MDQSFRFRFYWGSISLALLFLESSLSFGENIYWGSLSLGLLSLGSISLVSYHPLLGGKGYQEDHLYGDWVGGYCCSHHILSHSLYSLARWIFAGSSHLREVCAWLDNEGRGGKGCPVSSSSFMGCVSSSVEGGELQVKSQLNRCSRSLQLKAFLGHVDSGTELELISTLIYAWHELVILVFTTEVVFNYFKCFSVDFFIVMTLKELNLV